MQYTNLTHPTMIRKIRQGLYYASKGQGHMMQGHGKRVYIQNRHGHNIMRLDWVGGREGYIVYSRESRNITRAVRLALHKAVRREAETVLSFERTTVAPVPKLPKSKVVRRVFTLSTLGVLLSGCQASGSVIAMANVVSSWLT